MTRIATGLVLSLAALATCAVNAGAARAERTLSQCIGDFCVGSRSISEASIVRKYGAGNQVIVPIVGASEHSRCYSIKGGKSLVLVFGAHVDVAAFVLTEVMITEEQICKRSSKKEVFGALHTARGLTVGQLATRVIEQLGRPDRVDDAIKRESYNADYRNTLLSARFGDQVDVYLEGDNSLLMNAYFLRNGRVHSILVSESE